MRAAVFEGDGVVTVTERPDPGIVDSRDVILRVAANGICGSDLHALRVPPAIVYPPGIVIGHEYVGMIEEAGPASPYAVGTRVVVHPNVVCGYCWYCRNGRSNVCEQQDALGCTSTAARPSSRACRRATSSRSPTTCRSPGRSWRNRWRAS